MIDKEIVNIYKKAYKQMSRFVAEKCNGLKCDRIADAIDMIGEDESLIMRIISEQTDGLTVYEKEVTIIGEMI